MKLYILRHGQSESNFRNEFPIDSADLTEIGHAQAKTNAAYLADKKIEEIHASPLLRAQKTAGHLSTETGLSIITQPHLRDTRFGDIEGKHISDPNVAGEIEKRKQNRIHHQMGGGESYGDVVNRVTPVLKEILQSDKSVVATVAHLDVNRIMLSHLLNIDILESVFCQSTQ